jgi:hypothetical protein
MGGDQSYIREPSQELYIMHMIESVTTHTFGCNKEHHPLRIKKDLKALMEERRAVVPCGSSPLELCLEGEGSKETSPHLLFERCLA